jgi:hypothetical protein
MKKTYYVYKLTDKITNEFYYGSRSCYGNSSDDTSYMGSMVTWQPNKINLIKEIIRDDFNSRDELMRYESSIIKEHINNPLNRNYHIPNEKFHIDGSAGRLYKTRKILLEKAKEAGVEVKSKWGLEEQEEIYNILNGISKNNNTNPKRVGITISYTKLDSPYSTT